MKRGLLAVLFMILTASIIFAEGNTTAITEYQTEIINETGIAKTTVIPITTIRPKIDKVSAYEVLPRNGNACEAYVGLYDDTTLACAGERLGEKEALQGSSAGERFIRPKKIANGVVVIQGANTIAQVYFVRE